MLRFNQIHCPIGRERNSEHANQDWDRTEVPTPSRIERVQLGRIPFERNGASALEKGDSVPAGIPSHTAYFPLLSCCPSARIALGTLTRGKRILARLPRKSAIG